MCYPEGVVCGSHVGTYSAHEPEFSHVAPLYWLQPSVTLTPISSPTPRRAEGVRARQKTAIDSKQNFPAEGETNRTELSGDLQLGFSQSSCPSFSPFSALAFLADSAFEVKGGHW